MKQKYRNRKIEIAIERKYYDKQTKSLFKKPGDDNGPYFQIGKASLTPEVIEGIREAIDKRELVKVSVLKNCFDDPREIAEVLAERTRSEVVQVIGKKIVLYKPAKENSKIVLP